MNIFKVKHETKTPRTEIIRIFEEAEDFFSLYGDKADDFLRILGLKELPQETELFQVRVDSAEDPQTGEKFLSYRDCQLCPTDKILEPQHRFMNLPLPPVMGLMVGFYLKAEDNGHYKFGKHSFTYRVRSKYSPDNDSLYEITVLDGEKPLFIQEARVKIDEKNKPLIRGGKSSIPQEAKNLSDAKLDVLAHLSEEAVNPRDSYRCEHLSQEQLSALLDIPVIGSDWGNDKLIGKVKDLLSSIFEVELEGTDVVITSPEAFSTIGLERRVAVGVVGDKIYSYCKFIPKLRCEKKISLFADKWNGNRKDVASALADENSLTVFTSEAWPSDLDHNYLVDLLDRLSIKSRTVLREFFEYEAKQI